MRYQGFLHSDCGSNPGDNALRARSTHVLHQNRECSSIPKMGLYSTVFRVLHSGLRKSFGVHSPDASSRAVLSVAQEDPMGQLGVLLRSHLLEHHI